MEKAASLSMRPSLSDSPQFSHSLGEAGAFKESLMRTSRDQGALDAPRYYPKAQITQGGSRKRPGPPGDATGRGLVTSTACRVALVTNGRGSQPVIMRPPCVVAVIRPPLVAAVEAKAKIRPPVVAVGFVVAVGCVVRPIPIAVIAWSIAIAVIAWSIAIAVIAWSIAVIRPMAVAVTAVVAHALA